LVSLREYVGLTKALAESAKASAEALVNSERAWVVPIDIKPPDIHTAPGVGNDVYNSFTFDLVNLGRTVARLTGPFKARFCSLLPGADLAGDPDYGEMGADGDAEVSGRVLTPQDRNGSISVSLVESVNAQKLKEIEDQRLLLYAYASLTYYDSFGRKRELQFGYTYRPSRSDKPARWVLIGKPEYNKHT
jgi:hypothetical protein